MAKMYPRESIVSADIRVAQKFSHFPGRGVNGQTHPCLTPLPYSASRHRRTGQFFLGGGG